MKIVADNTVPFLKGIAEPIAEVKYLTSKEFTPENVQGCRHTDRAEHRQMHPRTARRKPGEVDYQRHDRFRPYRHPVLRRGRYRLGRTRRDAMPFRSPNMYLPDCSRLPSVRVNLYRERQSGSSESVMSAKKWKSCARPTG